MLQREYLLIRRLQVEGLNDAFDVDLRFHDDLNILTGRNGSGKTTILKLIWYLISGNIERIEPEISYKSIFLETDSFRIKTENVSIEDARDVTTWWFAPTLDSEFERVSSSISVKLRRVQRHFVDPSRPNLFDDDEWDVDDLNRKLISYPGGSLFFPTFRRIEGGFSLAQEAHAGDSRLSVAAAVSEFSKRLSVEQHKFIAAISTRDVAEELAKHYTAASQQINREHAVLSQRIISKIQQRTDDQDASRILSEIEEMVKANAAKQDELLRPFDALSGLAGRIFQHKGIKLTREIHLGQPDDAIASEHLSAGEKQMLSFMAYNAFSTDNVIFIDEPEISLHVDWQRTLFPTLLGQGSKNQFIIATHSPFIFSKYEDKELNVNTDRGNAHSITNS